MAFTLEQLNKKIEELQAKRETLQTRQRKPAINRILTMMREFGISPNDILLAFGGNRQASKSKGDKEKSIKGRKVKKSVEAKYRNAETGESWSGRGKPPRWLTAAEAAGKSRENFRIQPAQADNLPSNDLSPTSDIEPRPSMEEERERLAHSHA